MPVTTLPPPLGQSTSPSVLGAWGTKSPPFENHCILKNRRVFSLSFSHKLAKRRKTRPICSYPGARGKAELKCTQGPAAPTPGWTTRRQRRRGMVGRRDPWGPKPDVHPPDTSQAPGRSSSEAGDGPGAMDRQMATPTGPSCFKAELPLLIAKFSLTTPWPSVVLVASFCIIDTKKQRGAEESVQKHSPASIPSSEASRPNSRLKPPLHVSRPQS